MRFNQYIDAREKHNNAILLTFSHVCLKNTLALMAHVRCCQGTLKCCETFQSKDRVSGHAAQWHWSAHAMEHVHHCLFGGFSLFF